jgi:hypothetical protein
MSAAVEAARSAVEAAQAALEATEARHREGRLYVVISDEEYARRPVWVVARDPQEAIEVSQCGKNAHAEVVPGVGALGVL